MTKEIDFYYDYKTGDANAFGSIKIADSIFEFDCTYLFSNPFEDLFMSISQLVPSVVPFPRNQITFIMYSEPFEYRWEFNKINDGTIGLKIFIKEYEPKFVLVFAEDCELKSLVKAILQQIQINLQLLSNQSMKNIYKSLKQYVKKD